MDTSLFLPWRTEYYAVTRTSNGDLKGHLLRPEIEEWAELNLSSPIVLDDDPEAETVGFRLKFHTHEDAVLFRLRWG